MILKKYSEIIENNIDILVAKKSATSIKFANVHNFNGKLPANLYVEIQNDLSISSPEMLFWQMATYLSIENH